MLIGLTLLQDLRQYLMTKMTKRFLELATGLICWAKLLVAPSHGQLQQDLGD